MLSLADIHASEIPDCARSSWVAFLYVCEALEADDVELVVEEFVPFSALFNKLVAAGVKFDESFVVHVRELQASMVNTEDDPFFDHADAMMTEAELTSEDELITRWDCVWGSDGTVLRESAVMRALCIRPPHFIDRPEL